jgi:hypothetical protein
MTAIACRALTQDLVRHWYHTPHVLSISAYLHWCVNSHYYHRKKLLAQALLHVSSCCAAPVLQLPTDMMLHTYIATSFAYTFHIFVHYNIRTISR